MENQASAVQATDEDILPSLPSPTHLLEQPVDSRQSAAMQMQISESTCMNPNPVVSRNVSCMSLDSVCCIGVDEAASVEAATGIADPNECRARKRHRVEPSVPEPSGVASGSRPAHGGSANDCDQDEDQDEEFQPKAVVRTSHMAGTKPASFFPQISASLAGMAAEPSVAALGTQGRRSLEDDGGDSSTCPICLDVWGISGPHRVVALKCGHLFGQSCVRKWLLQGVRKSAGGSALGKSKCPECNQAASRRDMRPIFARSVVAIDDEKLSELQKEVGRLTTRLRELEADVAHYQLKYMQMRNEVKRARDEHELAFKRMQVLELQNAALEKRLAEDKENNEPLAIDSCLEEPSDLDGNCKAYVPVFRLCSTTQVARGVHEASRVLAVDPHEPAVYASCSNGAASTHTMVRVDIVANKEPVAFALPSIHKDEIRGAEISPFQRDVRYLLTASMDQTAALTMLACAPAACGSSSMVMPVRCSPVVAARLSVGAQAWSCAWDACDPYRCYVGTAGGRVLAFDLRHPSAPQMVWDGPRSGAVHVLAPEQTTTAPNYSPVHSMVAIRLADKDEGRGERCRLVVANTQHIYALPEQPNGRWIRLTGDIDREAGRSCLSISFDARTSCVGASFRAPDGTGGRMTVHELYEIGFAPLVWQRRREISVPSAQNRWARSTAFSCRMAASSRISALSLFGAAVEASRCVRLWDVEGPRVRDVASLDVAAPEDIVDVRAGQWSEEGADDGEADGPTMSPAFVASLTTRSLRIYQIE